jgi:cytochrome P450 PksS
MASRIDFAREAFFRDPADGIAKLRASGPVVATRFPIVGRVWVTTTYEAAARVLKDSAVFTLRKEPLPVGLRQIGTMGKLPLHRDPKSVA